MLSCGVLYVPVFPSPLLNCVSRLVLAKGMVDTTQTFCNAIALYSFPWPRFASLQLRFVRCQMLCYFRRWVPHGDQLGTPVPACHALLTLKIRPGSPRQ